MIDEKKEQLIAKHFELKNQIDKLTKEDEYVKTELRETMNDENLANYRDKFGNKVIISVSSRENFDKKGLFATFGEDKIKPFIQKKEFTVMKLLTAESIDKYQQRMKSGKGNKLVLEEVDQDASEE